MTRLPVLSGAQLVRRLSRLGFEVDRQTGGHIILRHIEPPHRRLSIPNHKVLAKGTLRAIIRAARLTVDEIVDAG